MAYKMLALDLDGTLTNDKKEITAHTKEVLHRAIAKGVTVVLASGRPVIGILPVAKQLELDRLGGYVMAYNGGQIVDCKTGQDVYRAQFPPELIAETVGFARKHNIAIVTYDKTDILTEGPMDEYVEHESFNNHIAAKQVADLPSYVTFPIVKMVLCGEPSHIVEMEKIMAPHFAGRLDIYKAEPVFLELMPLGIRKSAGLERLMTLLGVRREELMACGDATNDLSMLELAGMGVGMANGVEEVRRMADYVTGTNNEDGVAAAVEKFILQGETA